MKITSASVAARAFAFLTLVCATFVVATASHAQEAFAAADVGGVGIMGSTSVSDGVYTLRGAGEDVYGARDEFHYYSRHWTGDGMFVVRVTSVEFTFNWAKAGIMIRSDLADNAQHAYAFVSPEQNTSLVYRATSGGSTTAPGAIDYSQKAMPVWIKLTRAGDSVAMDYSRDGVNWLRRSSTTIALPDTVNVGLAVNSHDDARLCTATFDNFALEPVRPTRLYAIARSSTQVFLRWQDNDLDETGFEIERSTDNIIFSPIGTAPAWQLPMWSATMMPVVPPSFTDTTASPSTRYYYRVRALTPRGASVYSNIVSVTTPAAAPVGWNNLDVGDTALTGTSSRAGDVFTIAGAGSGVGSVRYVRPSQYKGDFGADVAGYSDEFQYCWQPWSGTGEIVARLTGVTGGASGHAGVMVRVGNGASAYNVFCHVKQGAGIGVTARPGAGSGPSDYYNETKTYYTSTAPVAAPTWLKVVRATDGVLCYSSSDGAAWSEVAWVPAASWPSDVQFGFAVSSRQDGSATAEPATISAAFDNVAVRAISAPIPPPFPPTNLRTTQVGQTFATIAWDLPPTFDRIELERSTDGVSFTLVNAPPSGWTDTSLTANTTYYYRARSVRGSAVSAYSETLTARTLDYPTAPANLTATVISSTEVRLSWADTSTSESGFTILRSTDNAAFAYFVGVAADTTSFLVNGLTPGTTYHFRVEASPTRPGSAPAVSNTASATPGSSAPPPSDGGSWQYRDIGDVAAAGTTSESAGTVTLRASGADIWNTADEFHFHAQSWTGDGTITARVTGLTDTNGWAKAGVMFRESLSADARHAMMIVSIAHGSSFQYRTVTGGESGSSAPSGLATLPRYLRLVRSGSTITGFESTNGSTWTQTGTVTLSGLPATIYVGLAATSHNDGVLTTASFDNVSVSAPGTTGELPPPAGSDWQSRDIGTAKAGTTSGALPTVTLAGSGRDIWNATDGFRYYFRQTSASDSDIIARVSSLADTNGWAKAGVMFRQTLEPGSPFAMMIVSVAHGTAFQFRGEVGAEANTSTPTEDGPAPRWVRVSRRGVTFHGYTSTDGVTWREVASFSSSGFTSTGTFYVGLAVTSHNDGMLCTAAFDKVAFTEGLSAGTPPNPPANLVATMASATQVNLTWTDGSTDETGFEVERSGDGTNFTRITTAAAGVTGYSDSGLSASTTYYYRVRAVNGAGASSYAPIAVATTTTAAPPPADSTAWWSQDIGAVSLSGSSSASGGTIAVHASGADIWDSSDEFHYRYRAWTGDGVIVARVAGLAPYTHDWSKMGLMFRETLSAGSRHAFMCFSAGRGVALQYRSATAGATVSVPDGGTGVSTPGWLRLVRSGNTFTGYYSENGVTWQTAGTATIALPPTIYVGFAATSHNDGMLVTAEFDTATLQAASAPPSPTWSFGDIGAVGIAGSNTSTESSITVNASGADIWETADGFRFVYRAMNGDCTVDAQVSSLTDTHAWAKAGVMIRESLAPDARNVFAFLTPGNGAAAQARPAPGAATAFTEGPWGVGIPFWVRLVRTGTRITALASADGVWWQQFAAYDVAMGATVYVGFAVTSHDNTKLTTAVFNEPYVR